MAHVVDITFIMNFSRLSWWKIHYRIVYIKVEFHKRNEKIYTTVCDIANHNFTAELKYFPYLQAVGSLDTSHKQKLIFPDRKLWFCAVLHLYLCTIFFFAVAQSNIHNRAT